MQLMVERSSLMFSKRMISSANFQKSKPMIQSLFGKEVEGSVELKRHLKLCTGDKAFSMFFLLFWAIKNMPIDWLNPNNPIQVEKYGSQAKLC